MCSHWELSENVTQFDYSKLYTAADITKYRIIYDDICSRGKKFRSKTSKEGWVYRDSVMKILLRAFSWISFRPLIITVLRKSKMIWTPERLEHDWFIHLKQLADFPPPWFTDLLPYWRHNGKAHITNKCINMYRDDPSTVPRYLHVKVDDRCRWYRCETTSAALNV